MAKVFMYRVFASLKRRSLLTKEVFEEVIEKKDDEVSLGVYLINNGLMLSFLDVVFETNDQDLFYIVMLKAFYGKYDTAHVEWELRTKFSESLCRYFEALRRRDTQERAKLCTINSIDTD